MNKFFGLFKQNPAWMKILLFSLTLFFLRIADGIIAFWAPNQIQEALGNSIWMGMVISFQSVIGLLSDIFLPNILKNAGSRKLLIWAIILSTITSLLLIGSSYMPFVLLFLIAMAVWGIYYELLHFAQFLFIGRVVPSHDRSGAWGIINVFASISYFLGPLIGAAVLIRGIVITESVFLALIIIGLFLVVFLKVINSPAGHEEFKKIKPLTEINHWQRLLKVIWPLVLINMLLGFVDSTFWTTGAVWTDKLAHQSFLGGLFLSFYQLPTIFMGLLIAKFGIYKGKKAISEKLLIIAGIFLMLFGLSSNILWILLMVLLTSAAIGASYPLVEGVYSDLIARMGHDKEDMIGLSASTLNLSYIIWPPIAGFLSNQIGERMSFSYLGLIVILTAVGLLFVTPKKFRLPQTEIKDWK